MLQFSSLLFAFLFVWRAVAQSTILSGTAAASTTNLGDSLPTGSEVTYVNYGSTITVPSTTWSSDDTSSFGTMTGTFSTMAAANSTTSTRTRSSSSTSKTLLVGGQGTSGNSTGRHHNATSTSTSAQPTNTQPCNGYPEFCTRSFSNITYVAAHNSPFVRPGNAASNQQLDVTTQLEDGIRMCK